jgi:photosystem II protein
MNTKARIEFLDNLEETSLPIINLTKSKNGKTGTATFIFVQPHIFETNYFFQVFIKGIYLIWNGKKIVSHDIHFFFKNGKPFALKTIFIFKNAQEWFNFLNFMTFYSKETGLFFKETNS